MDNTIKALRPDPVADDSSAGNTIASVVEALCQNGTIPSWPKKRDVCKRSLPSRDVVVEIVELLRTVLFPGYFGNSDLDTESVPFHIGSALDGIQRLLGEQIKRGICFAHEEHFGVCAICDQRAQHITRTFLSRLPHIKRVLGSDVIAAFEGDPAAHSPEEAIFCYPGLMATTNYRIAHELHVLGVPLLPRMITEHAHSITGIDIHPGATIGERFFIDHGTGVVIGETATIGNGVRIYQGVTLGAKPFPLNENGNPIKGIPRHPIVEDDVTLYAGATVLGRVVIGKGSIVGGNVWLTHGVPPGSRVTQASTRQDCFEGGAGI